MEGHYSVKQAAAVLKVTTKTIRNRIASKELPAVWEDRGKGMSQWWIPIEAVNEAAFKQPTNSVTISTETLKHIIQNVVHEAVKQEIKPLRDDLANLQLKLKTASENKMKKQ